MPTINGTKGAYLQPSKYGVDSSGFHLEYTWQGTRNEIQGMLNVVIAAGGFYEVQESHTGAADTLHAFFPSQPGSAETPVNDWEFFAGEVEKDILESDASAVRGISDDDKRKIINAIDSPVAGQSPSLTDPNAISLYLLMLKGMRSVRVLTPCLRHTQTVSNRWQIPSSLANVGRIISTGSLYSQESIPSTITLPSGTGDTEYAYGWYKKHPTIRTAAFQRTQIVQEWEYGYWSILVYGAAL